MLFVAPITETEISGMSGFSPRGPLINFNMLSKHLKISQRSSWALEAEVHRDLGVCS